MAICNKCGKEGEWTSMKHECKPDAAWKTAKQTLVALMPPQCDIDENGIHFQDIAIIARHIREFANERLASLIHSSIRYNALKALEETDD